MHVFCMGDDVWFFSRWIKALHAMTYDKWSKMLIVRYPDRIILPLHTACRYLMAIPVVEFSGEGYKIRKVFG